MNLTDKLREKWLKKETVFKGAIFNVEHDLVKIPTGETAVRDIVRHSRDAVMLVITPDHKTILEKQWRAAVDKVTIEAPAGKVDPRDHGDSRHAALRELNEEVRLKPGKLVKIATGYNSPGCTDETSDFYLATDVKPVQTDLPRDKGEFLHLFKVTLPEAMQMIKTGEIKDAQTIMVIWYWQMLHLKAEIRALKQHQN